MGEVPEVTDGLDSHHPGESKTSFTKPAVWSTGRQAARCSGQLVFGGTLSRLYPAIEERPI